MILAFNIYRSELCYGLLSYLNQVLLVLGAAGGVGLAAVQIGKVCGATVIAVARFDAFHGLPFTSNF
jgi:NADPH:quinone reductase-like Zn-dependent oxidoreductase